MGNNREFIMKPKVDFCFKELMTDEKVRCGFIAAVLGIAPEEIRETILLPMHLSKKYPKDKLGILDVRVRLNGDTEMDIEIQVAPFELWAERSLFYLSKMYTDQIKEGEYYDVLQKCIHVGILDFMIFEEDEEYYSCFHLWEDSRRRLYTDKLELHILELPKLKDHEYPETELLGWARFINAESREEFEMLSKENEYLERAYKKLDVISADEKKRLEYEEREKAIRDYNHQMRSNWRQGHEAGEKSGYERGQKSGFARGEKSGFVKGEKSGFEKGQKSGFEKGQIETVRKFLSRFDVETVAETTGLPVETVREIKESRIRS